MTDYILFAVFPYAALLIAVIGGIYRYYAARFSYSSISSQLLENKALFWGSVPFHYGIIPVLLGHIFFALFPDFGDRFLNVHSTLYPFELVGMALGILTLFGLIVLAVRRMVYPNLVYETTVMDWVLLAALLVQAVAGVTLAVSYRWGTLWYHHTAVPWFWSLAHLDPQIQYITALPWIVKLHAFNAFIIIALFPFTRLVHIFTAPVTYLWRPFQVVIWNRRGI